jgi:hypothetical protein
MLENLLTHNKTDRKASNLGSSDGQAERFLDDCRREKVTGRCRRECHGQGSILALKELLLGVSIDVFLGRDYPLLGISLAPVSIDTGCRNRRRLNAKPNLKINFIDFLHFNNYRNKLLNRSRRKLRLKEERIRFIF